MKISLASAVSLTNLSENTLRRRIASGVLTRTIEEGHNGRSMILFDSIRLECCIPLEESDCETIVKADKGYAEAQVDLALLFLLNGRANNAIYWLELAIKQDHPEAMHWLGRCYIEGEGVPQNDNLGFMWLSKAAAEGHFISQEVMQNFRRQAMTFGRVCP